MTDTRQTTCATPAWVHWWANLTATVTLPLLLLGAEVTTKQVGMVDPDWPTPPWQLWLSSWRDSGLGFLIEHGHRLAGYTVGTCVIVLVLSLWLTEPRRWLRWLGVAALAGVVIQGVLGGMRVVLNAWLGSDLALIHGVFGQIVFSLLVTLAVCTSRRWAAADIPFGGSSAAHGAPGVADPVSKEVVRRCSLLVLGLLLLQLTLGAVLRHQGSTLGQRGHLLGAFAVVAAVVWLARSARGGSDRGLDRPLKVLSCLIVLQILLGVEAWLTKFAVPAYQVAEPRPLGRDLVRSAHVLVGALVLASAVVVALEAHRQTWTESAGADTAERRAGDLPHENIGLAAEAAARQGSQSHGTEVAAARLEGV
jgi:cytochrome c oxidase assembly protein subunit 15